MPGLALVARDHGSIKTMTGPGTKETHGAPAWVVLAAIFCIAFGVRLGAAILLPNIHQPDEIFQSLEQAHRVVFG